MSRRAGGALGAILVLGFVVGSLAAPAAADAAGTRSATTEAATTVAATTVPATTMPATAMPAATTRAATVTAATVASADPLERVVVPLDAATAFALDPANSRAVDLGDAETGTVQLSFGSGAAANPKGGFVQVFRAGTDPIDQRWVGRVDIAGTGVRTPSSSLFDLPVGDYVLLLSGFGQATETPVWSWLGGGYDASAARTLSVSAAATSTIDMTSDGTVSTRGYAVTENRSGTSVYPVAITVYAVIARNGRDELMPVSTSSNLGAISVLSTADYTLLANGSGRYQPTWLGDVAEAADATVQSAAISGAISDVVTMTETPALGIPLVKGVAVVGQQLTVDHGMPSGATYRYQWYADGVALSGKTTGQLTVTSALAGKRLSYGVTASGSRLETTTVMSLATPRVSTLPTGARVAGWMVPGYTMTMSPGTWPAGTTLSYQWLMDGFPISGATGTKLVVPPDGSLTTISVLITAKRPGYETVALTVERGTGGFVEALHVDSGVPAELPASQSPGQITGQIYALATGARIADAHVRIYSAGSGLDGAPLTLAADLTTDGNGYFATGDLAPGLYCVWVDPPASSGFGNLHYDCRVYDYPAGVRVIADSVTDATTSLMAGGKIKGTVTSSTGAKVAGAVVTAYLPQMGPSGYESMVEVAQTTTGSTGQYAFPGLLPNAYNLLFTGPTPLSHAGQWWSRKSYARSASQVWFGDGGTFTANATLSAYLPIGIPTITGVPNVGSTLTASHPITSGAVYSYQWFANGVAIAGATKKTLVVSRSLEGKVVMVRVIGVRSAYLTTIRSSAATLKVMRSAVPTVTGSPSVGRSLAANPGSWTTGTAFAYQWYRNGVALAGATARTYTLAPADRDARFSVRVLGSKAGYAKVNYLSASTTLIAQISYPAITGTPQIGSRLTAVAGAWTPGSTLTYQWYASGKAISGARASTLQLAAAQRGATITVTVTGSKKGYTTYTLGSPATARVAG